MTEAKKKNKIKAEQHDRGKNMTETMQHDKSYKQHDKTKKATQQWRTMCSIIKAKKHNMTKSKQCETGQVCSMMVANQHDSGNAVWW